MCKLRKGHKPITQKAKIVWRSVAIVHVVTLHQNGGGNDFTDANRAHFLLLWCELRSSESHVIRIASAPTDLNDSDAHDLKNVYGTKNTHLREHLFVKEEGFLTDLFSCLGGLFSLWMRKWCGILPIITLFLVAFSIWHQNSCYLRVLSG